MAQRYLNLSNEVVNEDIEIAFEDFRDGLEGFKCLPGFTEPGLGDPPQLDIAALQRNIMEKYEANPVPSDAINGRQTIEGSLQELAQINTGFRKMIPLRKNRAHNQRLKELRELMYYPSHPETLGVLVPDNFVTMSLEISAAGFAVGYLFSRTLVPWLGVESPELNEIARQSQMIFPAATTVFIAPLFGLGACTQRLTGYLPMEDARYLDEKVKEFYG